MDLPDLAVFNFSAVPEREARSAIRAVNRQVLDDFLPIWGSGYYCKLQRCSGQGEPRQPEIIDAEPVQAAAAIFLVDRPHISAALSYCSLNTAELPVAFVFTDLGDWTVTLSHEVLELIVDSTLGFFLTERDARRQPTRVASIGRANRPEPRHGERGRGA